VPASILEAIKAGKWDFEPEEPERQAFPATHALPGTEEKLQILAERVRRGLPLWHPSDRHSYDEAE
jgi:hypothetical protein